MNIYGHIKKSLIELEPIFTDISTINNESVLLYIRNSWTYIQKYLKNMEPSWSNHFNERLITINHEDLLITSEMMEESYRIFNSLPLERNVKSFMSKYMGMMESLLIFSKPFEESCDICQGGLSYFTEMTSHVVIKECRTCGSWFEGRTGRRLEVFNGYIVRPVTRTELIEAGIYRVKAY
ncbi:hypothetical protein AB4Z21_22810 [Paenibacillus sp. MCAF20]